jgi:ribosomal protein L39E
VALRFTLDYRQYASASIKQNRGVPKWELMYLLLMSASASRWSREIFVSALKTPTNISASAICPRLHSFSTGAATIAAAAAAAGSSTAVAIAATATTPLAVAVVAMATAADEPAAAAAAAIATAADEPAAASSIRFALDYNVSASIKQNNGAPMWKTNVPKRLRSERERSDEKGREKKAESPRYLFQVPERPKVFALTHRLRPNPGMAAGELNFFTLTHI